MNSLVPIAAPPLQGWGIGAGAVSGRTAARWPRGYRPLRDELGERLVDEAGGRLLGPASDFALIRTAAAARGIRFGTAFTLSNLVDNPDYAELIRREAAFLTPEADMAPATLQPVQGEFDWSRADASAAWAQANGKKIKLHLLNYPAHDFPWASAETVTSASWQGLIDSHFEAVAARDWARGLVSINVSNELADPTEDDGFRRHVWYDAAGPEWLVYCFEKARALWPTTPLYLAQDLQEQKIAGYHMFDAFLQVLDVLLANGAPIDGVNLQGHLTFERGWDGPAFRTHLEALRGRGLRIVVGEVDIRTGNTGVFTPAHYSHQAYDATAAYMLSQYLSIVLPFIDGGELTVWGLSDANNPWGANERPCLFDADLNMKRPLYEAMRELFAGR